MTVQVVPIERPLATSWTTGAAWRIKATGSRRSARAGRAVPSDADSGGGGKGVAAGRGGRGAAAPPPAPRRPAGALPALHSAHAIRDAEQGAVQPAFSPGHG